MVSKFSPDAAGTNPGLNVGYSGPAWLHFTAVRPDDFLVLEFWLKNFRINPASGNSPPSLCVHDSTKSALIIVKFPPQHIFEQAFFEASDPLVFKFSTKASNAIDLFNVQDSAVVNIEALGSDLTQQCGLTIPGNLNAVSVTRTDDNSFKVDVYEFAFEPFSPFNPPPLLKIQVKPNIDPPKWVQARLAGPSYLVFKADGLAPFQFSLPTLLGKLRMLKPSLAPDGVIEPSEEHTRVEAPFHLLLSPSSAGRWADFPGTEANPLPCAQSSWTELWHIRLGILRSEVEVGRYNHFDDAAYVRAIWSLDEEARGLLTDQQQVDNPTIAVPHNPSPFRSSLDAADRYNLVHLTSNYNLSITAPVRARRLMLSTLGAWLELEGDWPVTDLANAGALSVSQWRHRSTMGRDHYVRVVYEGFLYPFGHRAALIKTTERKILRQPHAADPTQKTNVAYLRQRMMIVIREWEKRFAQQGSTDGWTPGVNPVTAVHPDFGGPLIVDRFLPFSTVRIKTLVTPNLDAPEDQSLFWPKVGGVAFKFQIQALDRDGLSVEFRAPLLFVALDAHTAANIDDVFNNYNNGTGDYAGTEEICLDGQLVAYADSAQLPSAGSTVFPTGKMTLGVARLDGAFDEKEAALWPVMRSAHVTIPDLYHLAGVSQTTIAYERRYLQKGFGAGNAGEIFAKPEQPVRLEFSQHSERSGALVAPDMDIKTLSRMWGPSPGHRTTVGWKLEPKDFLGTAKLLGQFSLQDVLPSTVPQPNIHRQGEATTYTVKWGPFGGLNPTEIFKPAPAACELSLSVTTDVPADGSNAKVQITADLKNFALSFFGSPFLILTFDYLSFYFPPGKKPEVKAGLHSISFGGELQWIAALADRIPTTGFVDPPAVAVTPDGIAAEYSLALPNVSLGAFSLQHLSLGAALALSFVDVPASVRFHFAQRQSPCIVSMGPFGGGAFFALEMSTSDIQVLEMSLEFGAMLAVNLGVASGCIYALGGIYFKLEDNNATLYGYFRMGGEVDVLGLISASIELYLGLGYESGKAYGAATIEVEVEVCFFSFSVAISCERSFAGSGPDPVFGEIMGEYVVHKHTGQIIYRDDQSGTVFYLSPGDDTIAFVYDSQTGTYAQTSALGFETRPLRPSDHPQPRDGGKMSPWLAYCQAFVQP